MIFGELLESLRSLLALTWLCRCLDSVVAHFTRGSVTLPDELSSLIAFAERCPFGDLVVASSSRSDDIEAEGKLSLLELACSSKGAVFRSCLLRLVMSGLTILKKCDAGTVELGGQREGDT